MDWTSIFIELPKEDCYCLCLFYGNGEEEVIYCWYDSARKVFETDLYQDGSWSLVNVANWCKLSKHPNEEKCKQKKHHNHL